MVVTRLGAGEVPGYVLERVSRRLRTGAAFLLVSLLAGCQGIAPEPRPISPGHLGAKAPPTPAASSIPAPVRRTPFVPKPVAEPPVETYTVVVNDVPVKELLFALARDAAINVDIHPDVSGLATLNAVVGLPSPGHPIAELGLGSLRTYSLYSYGCHTPWGWRSAGICPGEGKPTPANGRGVPARFTTRRVPGNCPGAAADLARAPRHFSSPKACDNHRNIESTAADCLARFQMAAHGAASATFGSDGLAPREPVNWAREPIPCGVSGRLDLRLSALGPGSSSVPSSKISGGNRAKI